MKKHFSAFLFTFFILLLILISCTPSGTEKKELPSPLGEDGRVTILLDAGHGFGDTGCPFAYIDGLFEYQLTYPYTLALQSMLEDKGYTVLLTHDSLSFPSFSEITEKADLFGIDYDRSKISDNNVFDAYERAVYSSILHKEYEIDLMISIHINANADSDECVGFEVDYCKDKECSDLTVLAFNYICDELEATFPGRPCKRFHDSWEEAFIVTKYNPMPSILIETGFATTKSEGELLSDPSWQNKMLDAVARGIESYFTETR